MALSKDEQIKYKSLYLQTARQYATDLKENINQLGTGNETDEVVATLYLSAHSLAGQSAVMGYESVRQIASLLEKIFKEKKEKKIDLSDKLLKTLVESVDAIEKSLESIDKENQESDTTQTASHLREVAGITQ